MIKRIPLSYTAKGWMALGVFALVVLVILPTLNLATSPDHPLHVSGYIINLLG